MVNYLELFEEKILATGGKKFSLYSLKFFKETLNAVTDQTELYYLSEDIMSIIDLHRQEFKKDIKDNDELFLLIDGDIFFTIEKIDTAMPKEQANEIRLETIALIEKGLKMAEDLE